MRLRLRIQRNELPLVSTLWPISESERKHTIAQLLEKVDSRFPLEADHFGLEDYSVTLGGYELLHYHEIGTVCKDEDEILIRPLQTAEVRARTLLGRDEINPDGRHLRDGIPFGRPMLRQPARPNLEIPPMRAQKSNRLLESAHQNGGRSHRLSAEEEGLLRTMKETRAEYEAQNGPMDPEEASLYDMVQRTVEGGMTDEFMNNIDQKVDGTDERHTDTLQQLKGISRKGRLLKEREESDVEEDDGDFEPSLDDDASDDEAGGDRQEKHTPTNLLQYFGLGDEEDEDSEDEDGDFEDDNDSTSPASSDDSDDSSDDDDSSSSSDVSDDSEASWEGIESPNKAIPEESSAPTKSPKQVAPTPVPPGQGLSRTKQRNQRKKQQKKLHELKTAKILPADANMAALEAYEAQSKDHARKNLHMENYAAINGTLEAVDGTESNAAELVNGVGKTAASVSDSAEVQESGTKTKKAKKKQNKQHDSVEQTATTGGTLEERQQALLEAIASGGVDVTREPASNKRKRTEPLTPSDEPPEEMSSRRSTPLITAADGPLPDAADTSSAQRRNRLDIAGTRRLLFGSLGVRVPKSEQDRLVTQHKLAGRAGRNTNSASSPSAMPQSAAPTSKTSIDEAAEDEDPEAWRQKIKLRAVECYDEGVTLSEPPFPFVQFWDPQYKIVKKKNRTSGAGKASGKRRKTGAASGDYVETYDKYNQDGTGDGLDYDDPVEDLDDSYWEEGALMGDDADEESGGSERASEQLLREASENKVKDDFPALPDDVKTLPILDAADAKQHDYVVYTEMVLSAATGWSPSYATRTVKLVEECEEKGEWVVQRADRDLPVKEFDEDGNRVYGKFEMEGMSDDGDGEEDGRKAVMKWESMMEPRLLQRGEQQKA